MIYEHLWDAERVRTVKSYTRIMTMRMTRAPNHSITLVHPQLRTEYISSGYTQPATATIVDSVPVT